MKFSTAQIEALGGSLSAKHIKSRAQAGRSLSYIEGWWAISEANRIFGFDGWHRETVTLEQLGGPREVDGKFRVYYLAKVRITVGDIVREGCGYGSGIDRDLGQAHESALKESETDAMKRALMTFGNPFGLALYDKEQNGVEHDKPAPQATKPEPENRAAAWVARAEKEIMAIRDRAGMAAWSKANAATVDKLMTTDKALYNTLSLKIALRNDELEMVAA